VGIVSHYRGFASDRRSVVRRGRAADHLGMNIPWQIDGRPGDPDPLRRAARLEAARLAIEPSGPFAFQVIDLDTGPVGSRRTWGGAEELAHLVADARL
jgi:hypothetical protein